jgi:hypothetical protein
MANIRKAEHGGHSIEIHTTYRVFVDGKQVNVPLMVDDDGDVHCHALPNYQVSSALDLVKAMIDVFPDTFSGPPKRRSRPRSGKDHGGHHEPSHASHRTAGAARRRKPR